jgi:hypothetical protein
MVASIVIIDHGKSEAMEYTTAVSRTWRHFDSLQMRADFRELVHYATLAASSHNTQPWRFEIGSDNIALLPDFTRRCAAVDPDDHHLFASLGCAAENLLIAGYDFVTLEKQRAHLFG